MNAAERERAVDNVDRYEEPARCRWCGEWVYPPVCLTCGLTVEDDQ